MLKRPSSRRRSEAEPFEVNLVPMLDALVTMISFLLFSMSFLALVAIDSPAPITSSAEMAQKLDEKPLQLTLTIRQTESEIWSPFDRIPAKKIPHINQKEPDISAIHTALFDVKKQFPNENKIVLAPHPGINYDVLVSLMDAVKIIEKTDPTIFAMNPKTQVEEHIKELFPEIVFGNLLGGSE